MHTAVGSLIVSALAIIALCGIYSAWRHQWVACVLAPVSLGMFTNKLLTVIGLTMLLAAVNPAARAQQSSPIAQPSLQPRRARLMPGAASRLLQGIACCIAGLCRSRFLRRNSQDGDRQPSQALPAPLAVRKRSSNKSAKDCGEHRVNGRFLSPCRDMLGIGIGAKALVVSRASTPGINLLHLNCVSLVPR
jgi:hypothetical protein